MGGYAWVTLATNDSYSLGALVLAHSLKQVATQQQLAVLITPGVTNSMRTKLGEIFNVVKEVNILDSNDEANLRLLKRPELGITFTKLHCWRLTQFEKCVFLDADTLVIENCDELFEREELSAAPDIGWPDCFNSGVFVYRPSNETYEKLINFAVEKGSFDGGDQGLLNLYFSDWAHKDISKHLPFIYNMASTACYSYLPAFKQYGKNAKILHFIGSSKPWLQYFSTETRKVHPSEGLQHLEQILQHWWNIFCNLIHPALSPDMAGLAGAFAKLTLGQARTLEQQALDDHLRRQGWEVGNIDYLGRDSFDNIWSKICETLSITPEAESTPSVEEKITELATQEEASPEKHPEPSTQKESSPEKAETVEQLQTSPLPEPDKTESATTEKSPVESKQESKLEVTAESPSVIQSSDSHAKETKSVADAPLSPEIQSLPTSPISDTSAQPPKADGVAKIAPAGIVESSPGQQEVIEPLQSTPSQSETKETPLTVLKSPNANEELTKTEIPKVAQSPVPTSSEVQILAEPPKAQEIVIPQESSKAATAEVSKDVPARTPQVLSAEPPLTTPAEPSKTVLQAVPTDAPKEIEDIPVKTPKPTPIETPEAVLTESTKVSPTGTAKDESTSKTTPAEAPKATPTEPPKTTSAEIPKTATAEPAAPAPVETPKAIPAEIPKSAPTETPKAVVLETSKDVPVPKTAPAETVSAAPVETPKTIPAEIPKSAATETPKAIIPETSKDVPVETAKSAPVETPKTPVETSRDAPAESVKTALTGTTKDVPVKTSKTTPAETPKAAPTETPKDEPVEASKEVSKKGSKGKQTSETKEVPKQVTSKEAAQVPVSKVIEPTPPTSPQTPQATEPLSPLAKAGLQIESNVPNTPPPGAAQETASGPTPPPRKSAGAPKKSAAKKK